MNPIEAALRRIARDLDDAGKKWALIGGLAVSARVEPRTTRDVDLVVAVTDDADAEGLVYALRACGYRALLALEQTAVNRLSTVRFSSPGEPPTTVVDLLFASSGIEPEIVAAAEMLEIIPGLRVPVARLGHLLALKVLARDDRRRPQDWDDIRALLGEAAPEDLEDARAALRLIEGRGFHREKQLAEEFERLLREQDG
jgi:predicted nucleotidyltransferase